MAALAWVFPSSTSAWPNFPAVRATVPVIAAFSHPFTAILTALVLVVGMRHFAMGATTMIEDYARGTTRKMLIIFVISLSWVIAATGLFALARMAL